MLRILYANYTHKIQIMLRQQRKLTRQRHAHMYTCNEEEINNDLVQELEKAFIWKTLLTIQSDDSIVIGPEEWTKEQVRKAFEKLETHTNDDTSEIPLDPSLESVSINASKMFNLSILEEIDGDMVLSRFTNQIDIHVDKDARPVGWDMNALLREEGL